MQFQGYEPIFENIVYGKEDKLGSGDDATPITRTILVYKHRIVTENEAISYIQGKLNIGSLVLPDHIEQERTKKSELDNLISQVKDSMPQLIDGINTGDLRLIRLLKDNIKAPRIDGEYAENYLIKYGIIPTKILDVNKKNIEDWTNYADILENIGTLITLNHVVIDGKISDSINGWGATTQNISIGEVVEVKNTLEKGIFSDPENLNIFAENAEMYTNALDALSTDGLLKTANLIMQASRN